MGSNIKAGDAEMRMNDLKNRLYNAQCQLISRNKDIEHLWEVKTVEYQNIWQELRHIKNLT